MLVKLQILAFQFPDSGFALNFLYKLGTMFFFFLSLSTVAHHCYIKPHYNPLTQSVSVCVHYLLRNSPLWAPLTLCFLVLLSVFTISLIALPL